MLLFRVEELLYGLSLGQPLVSRTGGELQDRTLLLEELWRQEEQELEEQEQLEGEQQEEELWRLWQEPTESSLVFRFCLTMR